jgi:hypothetical protein
VRKTRGGSPKRGIYGFKKSVRRKKERPALYKNKITPTIFCVKKGKAAKFSHESWLVHCFYSNSDEDLLSGKENKSADKPPTGKQKPPTVGKIKKAKKTEVVAKTEIVTKKTGRAKKAKRGKKRSRRTKAARKGKKKAGRAVKAVKAAGAQMPRKDSTLERPATGLNSSSVVQDDKGKSFKIEV